MNEICRCCMEIGTIDLNLTFFESLSLATLIKICTNTAIEENDNLPKKICKECSMKLESCYLFVDNFHRVQKALFHALYNIPEEVVIKDEFEDTRTKFLEVDFTIFNEDNIKKEDNIEQEAYIVIKDDQSDSEQHENRLPFVEEYFNEKPLLPSDNLEDTSNEVKKEFNCLECECSFEFLTSLLKHCNVTGHRKPRRFQCGKCPKKFITKSHMKNHFATHAREKPYSCKECGMTFTLEKSLKRHMVRHPGARPLLSYKETSNQVKQFNCLECNENFPFNEWLLRHCRVTGHSKPRRFQCNKCSKTFTTKSQLKTHYVTHAPEKPHICEQCGMKFSQRTNLKRHMITHTGEKPFHCEICGRGFAQKNTLISHLHFHNGVHPYICEKCGKGCRDKSGLNTHLKKHCAFRKGSQLKSGNLKVECKICNMLVGKKNFNMHMDLRHGSGVKKFSCSTCGKRYAHKGNLSAHMNVHAKKRYQCAVCYKLFSQKAVLKIHERIHTGVKPHTCKICDRAFTQRGHLDTHMKTHTGVKPYRCELCGKSFATNGNLTVHKMMHTGETRYKCSVCDKGFLFSSKKRKHEITAHQLHHSPSQATSVKQEIKES